jgi:hypothetical protein
MRTFIVILLVLALCVAPGISQPPEKKSDAQSTYEPRSAPGEGQRFLQQFVGQWDVDKAFYPRGGGEPSRAKGECKQVMIHDGRFLQSEFVFVSGGAKTTGLGLIGFESATGKFTSIWTDSRQTGMSFRQAQDKFDGKQIVLFSKALGDDKQVRQSKTVTTLEDNGNRILHRQWNLSSDGQERLVMELVMKRKPQPAPRDNRNTRPEVEP